MIERIILHLLYQLTWWLSIAAAITGIILQVRSAKMVRKDTPRAYKSLSDAIISWAIAYGLLAISWICLKVILNLY